MSAAEQDELFDLIARNPKEGNVILRKLPYHSWKASFVPIVALRRVMAIALVTEVC